MNKQYFLGESACQKDLRKSSIVILPVPYDQTCTWQKGADKGPKAIIAASPHLEFYDIETDSEVYQRGVYTDDTIDLENSEEMIASVYQRVKEHLAENKFVVTIGGEHSVAIGSVKAYNQKYENLSVLQLDAHTDLRNEYHDSKYNHACTMARIQEFCPIVQVGIRSMDISEKSAVNKECLFLAEDLQDLNQFQNQLNKITTSLNQNVYITIDLDVFDPGIMPSTGTPEPGGLNWYQVLNILETVAKGKKIVGFDIMELSPTENKAPDFMAAKLIYKLLSYIWR